MKRSPLILLASFRSLSLQVTRLACRQHRFASSKRPTKYDSAASWTANSAWVWNLIVWSRSCAISLTTLWTEALGSKSLVERWNLLTSLRATVPALFRLLTPSLTPPYAGAVFLMVLPPLAGIFLVLALAAILDFGIVQLYQGFKNGLLISEEDLIST